jgi:hypothetical protein
MSIKIQLHQFKHFAILLNCIIMVFVWVCTIMLTPTSQPLLWQLGFGACLAPWIMMMRSSWLPEKPFISYFVLVEGEANQSTTIFINDGVDKRKVTYKLLPDSKCTPFGCWLAFRKVSASSNSPLGDIIPFLSTCWVFVPRFFMSTAEYKCLCRHLIWHSVV